MKFAETHEWVTLENGVGTVGISSYAQKELGEIVYVEFPEIGKQVEAGQEVAVLESTKAAADVYSPISGTIEEINKSLKETPDLINQSPENEGWIFKIRIKDLEELQLLMDADTYSSTFK